MGLAQLCVAGTETPRSGTKGGVVGEKQGPLGETVSRTFDIRSEVMD